MKMHLAFISPCLRSVLRIVSSLALLVTAAPVHAQFVESFDQPKLTKDPSGLQGWAFFTGDGQATMTFQADGAGDGSIAVDATHDQRGIWWALIKRRVSQDLNLEKLNRPEYELRVEARVRVSDAPRRVNLSVNTQRTTDFHSHLMEFDFAKANEWQTISMTTHDFPAGPGDTVFAQLALMDWGLEKYRVDIDYFKVDVVDARHAQPDVGVQVPYRPEIPDVKTFHTTVPVAQDSTIDLKNPEFNLNNWYVRDGSANKRIIAVNGTQYAVLRFDLSQFAGREIAGSGLLELTTQSVQRTSDEIKDFGQVRDTEIIGGDPSWDETSVTAASITRGQPMTRVVNGQMIIDWPITEGDGAKTYFTLSKPVLQRLVDGKTLGIAIRPLGSINAAFYAHEQQAGALGARLLFNVADHRKPAATDARLSMTSR
ncbi:MAG: hypothetical protein ACJ8OJ_13620 [Povalibacter sp.]